jgi:hypothetical protein
MKISKIVKAVLWGLVVGGLVGGAWFRIGYDPNANYMLLPGESPLNPMFSALRSAALVFLVFGAATTLLVAFLPARQRRDTK